MSDGLQQSGVRFSIAKLFLLTAAVGVTVGIARLIGKEYMLIVLGFAYLFGPLSASGIAYLLAKSKQNRDLIFNIVLAAFLLSFATYSFVYDGFYGMVHGLTATACFWVLQWILLSPIHLSRDD